MTEPIAPDAATSGLLVDVENLNYAYDNGVDVLRDVSFRMTARERVALVGPCGAGKSTLILHLNGLLPGDNSRTANVRIADLPASRDNLSAIRERVGLLFQDPDDQLFCPTVAEDVAFGPLHLGLATTDVRERVDAALEQVGMQSFSGRNTAQLSVGEKKRVALAGLLACRPLLLALDEPFSNLDPRSRDQFAEILCGFDGGLLIATHDLDTATTLCERVIVLDGGRIEADGETATTLANAALMARHGLEVPWRLRNR